MRNILRIKECREHRERMKLLTEKKEACSKKLKQLASNKFVNHSFLSWFSYKLGHKITVLEKKNFSTNLKDLYSQTINNIFNFVTIM